MVQGPPSTENLFLASFIIYNIFQKRKDEKDKILVCTASNTVADENFNNIIDINEKEGLKESIGFVQSSNLFYLA